jgi:hypothetical protein
MTDRRAKLSPNVEVYDSDGIQVMWRSNEDLQSWLSGKNILPIITPSPIKQRDGTIQMEMLVTRIDIQ